MKKGNEHHAKVWAPQETGALITFVIVSDLNYVNYVRASSVIIRKGQVMEILKLSKYSDSQQSKQSVASSKQLPTTLKMKLVDVHKAGQMNWKTLPWLKKLLSSYDTYQGGVT